MRLFPLLICLLCVGLMGFVASQFARGEPDRVQDEPIPQSPLTLHSRIFSDNPVNIAVAETLLQHVRLVAQEDLCLSGELKIAIYDAALLGRYAPGRTLSAKDYPIQIAWPFEPLPEKYVADRAGALAYLTRPHSPNHSLSHELGHLIFTVHVAGGQVDPGGYGSVAPDWLDEAAAILFDHPAKREMRRQVFRKTVKTHPIMTVPTLMSVERRAPEFHISVPVPETIAAPLPARVRHVASGQYDRVKDQALSLPDFYAQIDTILLYLAQIEARSTSCPLTEFVRDSFTTTALGLRMNRYTVTDNDPVSGLDEGRYISWLADWADIELTGGP